MDTLHRSRPRTNARSTPSSASATAAAGAPAVGRLVSLDAYRGLIMLTLLSGGIFQSLAGHPLWGWLAHHNEHVEWQGTVYWDLIQPAFMFMVSVAMPFAFALIGTLVVVGMNSIAAYVIGNAFGGWFRSATSAWVGLLAPGLGPVWLPVLQRALFSSSAWTVLLWCIAVACSSRSSG